MVMFAGLILSVIFLIASCSPQQDNVNLDKFAQCLSEKGVAMYGAFWCGHCNNQKKMFGDSWKSIVYVECSTSDGESQTEACKAENIRGYPTWKFADGKTLEGEVSFQQLSRYSGCALS